VRTSSLGPLLLAAALSLCLGLAGCGRKGPLEGPPGSNLPRAPRSAAKPGDAATPEAIGRPNATGAVVRPKTPFVLDPLL
jgi:predicted small lipoprotein YifL